MEEQLGGYRLIERLGQGGMAVVYRGERSGEVGFKKRVAIKRMLPQYRRDATLIERFAAEARTNARLDHPNLVQVLDFGVEPEPFLVLEFVDGVSLSQLMQRAVEMSERIEIAAAIFVAAEVAGGLDHAHRKRGDDGVPLGIVHRDVSPQNVLLSNEGSVKLSDFGLVKSADNVVKTASGMAIGKISYMAPEQAAGEAIDGRADIFALGVTLWEMLTLRSLIPPGDPGVAIAQIQKADWDPPSRWNASVPKALDAIVLSALKGSPAERTPSAQQLAIELRELLHATAPGYGRQQLARLLQWMFKEKGWALPAPEEPAAQPTAEDRASIIAITPAVEAMARAERSRSLPPPAPVEPRPAPHVPEATLRLERPSTASSWLTTMLFVVLPVLAVLVLVGASLTYYLLKSQDPNRVSLTCGAPDCQLFLGTQAFGRNQADVHRTDVGGRPMIAIARGHEPMILRPERLETLLSSETRSFVFGLRPSGMPSRVVYVTYDGEGTISANRGLLGHAPGAVIVPANAASVVVRDVNTGIERPFPLQGCTESTICVLNVGPLNASTP